MTFSKRKGLCTIQTVEFEVLLVFVEFEIGFEGLLDITLVEFVELEIEVVVVELLFEIVEFMI